MRIALTGATGYVGPHVVAAPQQNSHQVAAFVRNRDRPIEVTTSCLSQQICLSPNGA